MARYKISVVLILLVMFGFFSCKKKSNDNPFANAKIGAITYTYSGVIQNYSFFYDVYNNVDSAAFVGAGTAIGSYGYHSYTYFGSSFSITDASRNSYTVYANSLGQIIKVLVPDTLIMTYENNVLTELDTKVATGTYPFYSRTSVYYTWVGGDLTYSGPAGTATGAGYSYYYDKSRNGQPGDPMRVDDFLTYGRSYIKTTHLPLGMISSGDTLESYSYTYDALGRISRLSKALHHNGTHDTATYDYKYY